MNRIRKLAHIMALLSVFLVLVMVFPASAQIDERTAAVAQPNPGDLSPVVPVQTNLGWSLPENSELQLFSIAHQSEGPFLYQINPATAETVSFVEITLSGSEVYGGNGLAAHPDTGVLWAVLQVDTSDYRILATIDPATGLAAEIGDLGDYFAALAFDSASTLYGLTGVGANVPETLFSISTTDASTTQLAFVGNDMPGEALAYNSQDGYLYHAAWDGDDMAASFQTIDTTTYATSGIDIADSALEYDIPQALAYRADQNVVLWAQENGDFYAVTPAGSESIIGTLDHKTKGLAFAAGVASSSLVPTEGPINLYYKLTDAPGGGYNYDFTLRVDEPINPGDNLDAIVFFDNQNAPSRIKNFSLVGPPPPPFTGLSYVGGEYNGPVWYNDPNPGWQPVNVGAQIQWTIHADNIVGSVLWSNFLGAPQAAFRRAIQLPSADDPINLYYTCDSNPGGGYDYTFMLRLDEITTTEMQIDQIIFFDKATYPSDIINPTLIGPPPPPFKNMETASGGGHHGPSFVNVDPDPNWTPNTLGDKLQWKIHADNLVEPIYWSNLENQPVTYFRQAIPAFFSFDLYFGTTNPPPLLTAGIPDWWCNPTPSSWEILQSCTDYYWRVALHNSIGQTHSPVWTFKTNQVGDLDQDEDVDLTDFASFTAIYNQGGCGHPDWCGGADIDRDGDVTLIDVHHFSNQWLHTCVLDIPE